MSQTLDRNDLIVYVSQVNDHLRIGTSQSPLCYGAFHIAMSQRSWTKNHRRFAQSCCFFLLSFFFRQPRKMIGDKDV